MTNDTETGDVNVRVFPKNQNQLIATLSSPVIPGISRSFTVEPR
jgi:hypothetical protein